MQCVEKEKTAGKRKKHKSTSFVNKKQGREAKAYDMKPTLAL
jgi:hypothetical protein